MQKLSFQLWLQIATEVFRKDSRKDAWLIIPRIKQAYATHQIKLLKLENKIKKHQEQLKLKINSGPLKATQEERLLGNTQKKCQLFTVWQNAWTKHLIPWEYMLVQFAVAKQGCTLQDKSSNALRQSAKFLQALQDHSEKKASLPVP